MVNNVDCSRSRSSGNKDKVERGCDSKLILFCCIRCQHQVRESEHRLNECAAAVIDIDMLPSLAGDRT